MTFSPEQRSDRSEQHLLSTIDDLQQKLAAQESQITSLQQKLVLVEHDLDVAESLLVIFRKMLNEAYNEERRNEN